jgi:hypothetical protein
MNSRKVQDNSIHRQQAKRRHGRRRVNRTLRQLWRLGRVATRRQEEQLRTRHVS